MSQTVLSYHVVLMLVFVAALPVDSVAVLCFSRLVLPVLVYLPCLHSQAFGSAAAVVSQTVLSYHVVLTLVFVAALLVDSVAVLCFSHLVLPVLVYLPCLHSQAFGSAVAVVSETVLFSHVVLKLLVFVAALPVDSVAVLCFSHLVLPVLVYLPGLHSLASGSAAALFQTAPSSHVVLMLQVGSAARLVGSVAALCQSVSLSRQPAVLVACPNSLTAVVAVNVC